MDDEYTKYFIEFCESGFDCSVCKYNDGGICNQKSCFDAFLETKGLRLVKKEK